MRPNPVILITGANSGIGKSMATQLAARGARVVMVCRNPEKAEAAKAEIERAASGGGSVELLLGDLSSMDQVRHVAEAFRRDHDALDVLVNNAGLYLPNRQVTPDGFEYMFAVNHLAAFLLTRLLEEPLVKDGGGRVVTVSSGAHMVGHLDFDDLQVERGFVPMRQYGSTKLANILFTRELARRWGARGIVANCFHPGAVGTGFAQDEPGVLGFLTKLAKPLLKSPDKAAETGVHLAVDPEATRINGGYFIGRKPKKGSRESRDEATAARLWDVSEQLTGLAV